MIFKKKELLWPLLPIFARILTVTRLQQEGMELHKKYEKAASAACNLAGLLLTQGKIVEAKANSQKSVHYAVQSNNPFQLMARRTTLAYVLHQEGEIKEALKLFQEAEEITRHELKSKFINSLWGFRYCDLLLEQGNTKDVLNRAEESLAIAKNENRPLDIAIAELTLGRAYAANNDFQEADKFLNNAVENFRHTREQDKLPYGLLARAALYRLTGCFDRVLDDLKEVFDIVVYSGMRLFLTDYHLEMTRLLLAQEKAKVPIYGHQNRKESVKQHLAVAEKLINDTGYRRRQPSLLALQDEVIGTVFTVHQHVA